MWNFSMLPQSEHKLISISYICYLRCSLYTAEVWFRWIWFDFISNDELGMFSIYRIVALHRYTESSESIVILYLESAVPLRILSNRNMHTTPLALHSTCVHIYTCLWIPICPKRPFSSNRFSYVDSTSNNHDLAIQTFIHVRSLQSTWNDRRHCKSKFER